MDKPLGLNQIRRFLRQIPKKADSIDRLSFGHLNNHRSLHGYDAY